MTTVEQVPQELVDELAAASKRVFADVRNRETVAAVRRPGKESPFGQLRADQAIKAYSGDQWGACSLETFADVSGLTYTHDDAAGFLDYLDNFAPYNYWLGDANVQVWEYEEAYDNWQDTWGADAVLVFYHSGHGGMDGNGVFQVPLGAAWDGRTWAFSNNMRLGNEQVKYIFWSTCLSCRVLEGQNPIRTWSPANLGFRMLFGYETVSVDDPDYGSAFWNHWRSGKSFSQAFCDASWYDISTHQAPSVVACGADATEASNRLYNERFFSWDAVSTNWWQWRWYYAAASAAGLRAPRFDLPASPLVARLRRRTVDEDYVASVRSRHDVPIAGSVELVERRDGLGFVARDGDVRLAVEPDGSYEVALAAANRENRSPIAIRSAIRAAEDVAAQHGVDGDGLVFDRVRLQFEAGGTAEGSGTLQEPVVTETVVQFTQSINGLPVLAPGRGQLSIGIDNDGRPTTIRNTLRPVDELTDRARRMPTPPGASGPPAAVGDRDDVEARLDDAWQRRMRGFLVQGSLPRAFAEVPGTTEIGYAIRGDEAALVARREVEVDHGRGISKRHRIEVPLAQ
jgi:hypothetical protein